MRIGFIGVGGIAQRYIDSLTKLGQKVTAFCDPDEQRAAKVAAATGAQPYRDHREMLSAQTLDAIFVAIPPGAHQGQVGEAAEAGAAVFVAKPVALDLETARRTLASIQRKGVIHQAGYMARYSDIVTEALALVGKERLGLGMGRFLCRMPPKHPWWGKRALSGGQVLEQSTHLFDLLRLFLGEIEQVQAFGHRGNGEDIADFEDSTVCNLRFAKGAVGCVTSTCCARALETFVLELSGRDLYVKLILDDQLKACTSRGSLEFKGQESGYFRQVQSFLQAVEGNNQALVRSSYEDAVRTLAATVAANESLASGGVPVRVAQV